MINMVKIIVDYIELVWINILFSHKMVTLEPPSAKTISWVTLIVGVMVMIEFVYWLIVEVVWPHV